jgi:fatty acid desaturase
MNAPRTVEVKHSTLCQLHRQAAKAAWRLTAMIERGHRNDLMLGTVIVICIASAWLVWAIVTGGLVPPLALVAFWGAVWVASGQTRTQIQEANRADSTGNR